MLSKQEALSLLYEWVKSESLRKHCLSVATAMEGYAKKYVEEGRIKGMDIGGVVGDGSKSNTSEFNGISHKGGEDLDGDDNYKQEIIDKWYICGLLHDFDYEKYPDINVHPKEGCKFLEKNGYPTEIIQAILGHNAKTGVKRESLMAKTLFAVDELSGLIVALAHVRPGKFSDMSAKSVMKAIKKKDFAAAINRDDINKGIEELGLNSEEKRNEHFETVIRVLEGIKKELGFH